jgi:adenylylsulfate kinase-like enzyme
MGSVMMLSGPVGAGKTTVARELVSILPDPLSYIEGDTFWSFIKKSNGRDRRENFRIIMRAMTAAALPLARSGYDVLIDFSIPPEFLKTARIILKDVPLNYVLLRPSLAVCASRACSRAEGKITDYASYVDFYKLFEGPDQYAIHDDEADASAIARRIQEESRVDTFRVPKLPSRVPAD